MFTDPIELPNELDTIEVSSGSHSEEVFRIADVGPSSSRRVATPAAYSTYELVIRNQSSVENKAAGAETTRTSVGIYATAPVGEETPTPVKASVNIVFSIPMGTTISRVAFAKKALINLLSFLLTAEDTAAADQTRNAVDTRLTRLLSGEP